MSNSRLDGEIAPMSESAVGDLTLLIQRASAGDVRAEGLLCESVYKDLHDAASWLLRSTDTSVQATMLVHDVFMGMFRKQTIRDMCNRRYFYAVAIDHMRKLLVDHHRRRCTQRAGGNWHRSSVEELLDLMVDDFRCQNQCTFEDLEEALRWLRATNERQFQVVTHRFFTGLTIKETAELLETSESSVERDWRLSRAKLYRFLTSQSLS